MRIFKIGALSVMLTWAVAAFAGTHSVSIGATSGHIADREYRVVALQDMKSEMLERFFTGKTPGVVLECTEGLSLPFNLRLKGQYLALDSENSTSEITIVKKCFIKCEENKFFFSSDLKSWKLFQDFFTGQIGVSVNVDEGKPTVCLNIEINQRT
jgi:hypothetical protein